MPDDVDVYVSDAPSRYPPDNPMRTKVKRVRFCFLYVEAMYIIIMSISCIFKEWVLVISPLITSDAALRERHC